MGNQLVVHLRAYLRELKKKEISDKQSGRDLHWAKNDPKAKLVLSMEAPPPQYFTDMTKAEA